MEMRQDHSLIQRQIKTGSGCDQVLFTDAEGDIPSVHCKNTSYALYNFSSMTHIQFIFAKFSRWNMYIQATRIYTTTSQDAAKHIYCKSKHRFRYNILITVSSPDHRVYCPVYISSYASQTNATIINALRMSHIPNLAMASLAGFESHN